MSEQIIIPSIGDKIAERYQILSELGRGAYGVVYHARDELNGLDVALKMLLPQAFLDPDIITRFAREAEMVSRLSHSNIIKLLDHGQINGLVYMSLEYVDGRTLGDLIETDAPIPPLEAERIITQILEALKHAHEQGIVHRDLKPENILLQRPTLPGAKETVKILDFGIAKLILGPNDGKDFKTLTQAGHSLGTPHYMAPEQIAGDVTTNQVDLYAVGTIFYQLLCGRHPFQDASNPAAVMVKHLHYDFPELPEGLEQTKWGKAMRAATVKQPLDRVASAQEFIDLFTRSEIETQDATVPLDVANLRASHLGFGSGRSSASGEFANFGMSAADQTEDPTVMANRPDLDALYSQHQAPQTQTPPHTPQKTTNVAYDTPPPFPSRDIPGREDSTLASISLTPVIGMLICMLLISIGLVFIMKRDTKQTPKVLPPVKKVIIDTSTPKPTRPNNPLKVLKDMGESDSKADAGKAPDVKSTTKSTKKPNDKSSTKRPNRKNKPKPKKKPEAKMVQISIQGSPSGASVYFNGSYVGQLPFRKRLPRSDKPIKVRVHRVGFQEKTIKLTPNANQSKTVNLKASAISL